MTAKRYLVYKLFRFFVGYLNIYYIFLRPEIKRAEIRPIGYSLTRRRS